MRNGATQRDAAYWLSETKVARTRLCDATAALVAAQDASPDAMTDREREAQADWFDASDRFTECIRRAKWERED